MKKIIALFISGILLITISVSAKAADFSYNFAQVNYDDITFSIGDATVDIDGDGFSVSGAFEITPDLFITADYKSYGLIAGLDLDVWDIGIGYHRSINAKTDLVAGLEMGNVAVSTPDPVFDLDLDIWSANAGVRHQLNDKVELGGKVTYVDYDGNDSDTRFSANVLYKFKKDLSGIFALEFGDSDVMSLGARFEF